MSGVGFLGGGGHEPHEVLLAGFRLGDLAGDRPFEDGVDAVRHTQNFRKLGRYHDDGR